MPRICYVPRNFSARSLVLIHAANLFIQAYQQQGYSLTLRQLYYRFVAKNILPNTMRDYKNLGNLINDARLAGLIDWEAIEDRTRNLEANTHWEQPQDLVEAISEHYLQDLWAGQEVRMEVWVEKEALVDVVGQIARQLDVPYFACRGYVSQSEMWGASQRLEGYYDDGVCQEVIVLHLGDHDPSGIDMTRDIQERLDLFEARVQVVRIALNGDQIQQYNPPPNPARFTDSRYKQYVRAHGRESWELDALEPSILTALIAQHIQAYRNDALYKKALNQTKRERTKLRKVAKRWDDVLKAL